MRQLLVPIVILTLFAGLVVPLPAGIIDYLLVINVTLAMLLLVSSLYINDPLKLSALPSFLLLATLFRLTLNISTTRLLLATGDPGEIIQAFGRIVVQDNLVVGLVIFLIITFIQLIVIAKGSERVAEVSARFTLDALPGKQMSIDADMRSGLIDFAEARKKRDEVQIESRFYGALDGAMKFIKGDAIAGIVITTINIIGGILIGILYNSLPIKAALSHYSLLTIGDGLLSQLPALLNSVAAGIVVTRVVKTEGSNLGAELFQQLLSVRPVKIIIASVALILSFLPGIPTLPFLAVSIFLYLFAGIDFNDEASAEPAIEFSPKRPEKLLIKTSPNFKEIFKSEVELKNIIETLKGQVYESSGIILDTPRFEYCENNDSKFQIYLRGSLIFAHDNQEEFTQSSFLSNTERVVLNNKEEFIDDIQTRKILDYLDTYAPELVANIVPDVITTTGVTKLLKSLVSEDISINNIDLILQSISENSQFSTNSRKILELVRINLKRQITQKYAKPNLNAVTLDTEIDISFYKAEKSGEQFDIENLELIKLTLEKARLYEKDFILLTSSGARKLIYDCLKYSNNIIPVVAYEEILSDVKINSILKVSPNQKEEINFTNLREVA